jgi:integrase/recombinase XerD
MPIIRTVEQDRTPAKGAAAMQKEQALQVDQGVQMVTGETGTVTRVMTDEWVIARFYDHKFQKSQSQHTRRAYQTDVERFRSQAPAALGAITPADLLEWSLSLKGSPALKARQVSTVRSLFRFAFSLKHISSNPAEILEVPQVPVTSENRFLTQAELQALLKEAQAPRRSIHLYPALVLLATTALRISELVTIQWCNFFEDMHGHIGLKVKGKGGKLRVVKVLPAVWTVLKEHRRRQDLGGELNAEDTTPLFLGAEGKHLTDRNLQKAMVAAAKAAGITKKVSPHWIRHTAITMALVNGARVEQAQAMAGHSDLRTTTRYAHTAQQLKETASDFIRLDI